MAKISHGSLAPRSPSKREPAPKSDTASATFEDSNPARDLPGFTLGGNNYRSVYVCLLFCWRPSFPPISVYQSAVKDTCSPRIESMRAMQLNLTSIALALILRERRHTSLTKLGQVLRPIFGEVLSQAQRAKSLAEQHLTQRKTVLQLGIISSVGLARLAPLLGRFGAEHLGFELQLVETSLQALETLLFGGQLDAAIVAYNGRRDKRLRYDRLYHERVVTVAAKGHRFEQYDGIRLHDLRDENLLFRANCELGEFLLESCRRRGFEPRIVYRSTREDWVQKMVATGFGVTIMPEFSHSDVATIARPLVDPGLVRQLSLVTVAGRRHEPAVASLLRAFRSHPWEGETPAGATQLLLASRINTARTPDKGGTEFE